MIKDKRKGGYHMAVKQHFAWLIIISILVLGILGIEGWNWFQDWVRNKKENYTELHRRVSELERIIQKDKQ